MWEYKVLKFQAESWFNAGKLDQDKFETEINKLGSDGWELVSVFDTNSGHGQTRDVFATFKRKK